MNTTYVARGIRAGLLLGCVGFVTGCSDPGSSARAAVSDDAEDDGHVHADEEVAIPVTVWDQGHELFIEYPAPVAGEPVQFITHVSLIDTGEPRREGPVTFHLVPEQGTPLQHVEAEPAREGIYLPEVVFPTAGTWTVSLEIPTDGDPVTIALPETTVYASDHDALHAPLPEEAEGVTYLKEQQWRLGTRTGLAETCTLTEMVRVPGVVKVLPGREARVTPPVDGVLEALPGQSLPELGQPVEAGQLLALVRPPYSDYLVRLAEARAAVTRADLEVQRGRLILERVQRLFDQKARSERELEEATFTVRLAEADAAAARAVLDSLESTGLAPTDAMQFELRSPIAGHVHHVDATLGELVRSGDSVMEVLDPSRVLIEARPRIDQLQQVTDLEHPTFVHLRGSFGQNVPLPAAEVRLLKPGDTVDARTRTVALPYAVSNPDLVLRIGQALDVLLPAGTGDCLAVPEAALVDEGGEATVYLQVSGETFERRPVLTGLRSDGRVEIVSGLEVGERIVIEGAYAIRLQSAAGTVPAHSHH